tara:strand:- start:2370 stop:3392 length:1023 start_codon:yes stop_codon:yes gene_type:complete
MKIEKKISINDKFLIAGAGGMVGSAICRSLKIHGYDNDSCENNILRPSKKELNYFDFITLEKWFNKNKPTVVIIAAAKVGGILSNKENPVNYLLDNLKIQNNLIECSFLHGVRRLLFLGSSCIYPKSSPQPIKEEYLLTGELERTNQSYSIAKIAGIKLCEALRKQNNFDAISLMPTNLYGPLDNYNYQNSHVLPALIRKFDDAIKTNSSSVICWGSGNCLREFLHVDDLAEAAVFCLENWDPNDKNAPKDEFGNPLNFLNIGSKDEVSIKELASKIATIFGFNGEIIWDRTKPDGVIRKKLCVKRITEMGWEQKIDLNKGLALTIESFKKEKDQNLLRI